MTFEELRKHISAGGSAYVLFRFNDWNDALSTRRLGTNHQAAWFVCQGKVVYCCHGAVGPWLSVRSGTRLQYVGTCAKKLAHVAREYGNGKIYLSSCHGADKIGSFDGIEVVPVEPTEDNSFSHPAGTPLAQPSEGFYVEDIKLLDYFIDKVVKEFDGKYTVFPIDRRLSPEERKKPYALAVRTSTAHSLQRL